MNFTVVKCDECLNQKRLLITFRSASARSTDKHFCSVNCFKEFLEKYKTSGIMKQFEIICDDENTNKELEKLF